MALYSIAMNKTKRQQQKEKNKNGRMLMTGLIVGTMVLALVLATVTASAGGGGVQGAKAKVHKGGTMHNKHPKINNGGPDDGCRRCHEQGHHIIVPP